MKKFALSDAFFKDDGAKENENTAHKLLASLLGRSAGTDVKNAEGKEKINVATKNKNAILAELYPDSTDENDDSRPLNGEKSLSGEISPAQSQNNAFFDKNSKSDNRKITKNDGFYKNSNSENAKKCENRSFSQIRSKENCKNVENPYFTSDNQDKNVKNRYLLQKNGLKVGLNGANTGKETPDNAETVKKNGGDDYYSPPPYYKLP